MALSRPLAKSPKIGHTINMKKLTIILTLISLIICACNTTPRTKKEVFTVDLKSPSVKIGEIEFQIDRSFLPGIKKATADVFYFPVEDAVSLQFRIDMVSLQQFWSSAGRDDFIAALETYKKDFEERNFSSNSRKSKKHYGTTKGYIIWQTTRFSVHAKAITDYELGYYFVERAPYFVTNQREAEYIDPNTKDNNRTSAITSLYFTRAQADALAALFDPKFIDSVTFNVPPATSTRIEVDEY